MRGKAVALLLTLALSAAWLVAQSPAAKTLSIYVIDVDGGNAQLWVMPSGESVIIDTGNGYTEAEKGRGPVAIRDADRIMAAVKDAGVKQIDHLITTHFHGDHFGALIELAARIPVKNFVDHGPIVQHSPQADAFYEQYSELIGTATHTVPKPGDKLPVSGVDWRIVNVSEQQIKTRLPGAPDAGAPNPNCAGFIRHDANPVSGPAADYGHTEDEQVVASHVTFGKFRALYLGDFDWNQEPKLVCPTNLIGTVDLFVVSRHGQPSSNSQALVHAIRPRVMIMNNGIRKGGQPSAMKIFLSSPRLEGFWQMHFATLGGQEYTMPGMFIANLDEAMIPVAAVTLPPPGTPAPPAPVHNGPANFFKVSAQEDGTFTVTNSRNGFSKTYKAGK